MILNLPTRSKECFRFFGMPWIFVFESILSKKTFSCTLKETKSRLRPFSFTDQIKIGDRFFAPHTKLHSFFLRQTLATKCDKLLTRLVALFVSHKPRYYAIFPLQKNCDNCDNDFHGRDFIVFQFLYFTWKMVILTIWCINDFLTQYKKWYMQNKKPHKCLSRLSQKVL